MFEAVCKEITAPMNVDISATIGIELIPINCSSSMSILQKILIFFGFRITQESIKKYAPMFRIYFTPIKVIFILSRSVGAFPVYL
jgi:hypothetical protein